MVTETKYNCYNYLLFLKYRIRTMQLFLMISKVNWTLPSSGVFPHRVRQWNTPLPGAAI